MTDPAVPEPAGVALLATGASPADHALARALRLPITETAADGFPLLLVREAGALQLCWSAPNQPGPVRVDFANGPTAQRLRTVTARQPLARAVGFTRGLRQVLDATAGLATDAATLAKLGCQVVAVERHPVLVALARDGLRRALERPDLVAMASRIELQVGDAREVMRSLSPNERPETVFLDPMFPKRGSAQVKKDSQLLRALVRGGVDSDLLEVALGCARRRVVVKRHPYAGSLGGGREPDVTVAGSRVRYDVYLV